MEDENETRLAAALAKAEIRSSLLPGRQDDLATVRPEALSASQLATTAPPRRLPGR